MKINKKLAALMMTLVIGGTVLTGCGQKTNTAPETEQGTTDETVEQGTTEENTTEGNTEEVPGTTDPSPTEEMVFVITDGIELPATMDMTEEMFADTYGIDTSLLENYTVKMPMMNVTATEIAVFEVKDEASIDAVKAGIEKRQAALEAQWSSYLPEQLELVKNYKTEVKGNLVLFVISEEADQIVEKFQA